MMMTLQKKSGGYILPWQAHEKQDKNTQWSVHYNRNKLSKESLKIKRYEVRRCIISVELHKERTQQQCSLMVYIIKSASLKLA